jgi:hypothetical protein
MIKNVSNLVIVGFLLSSGDSFASVKKLDLPKVDSNLLVSMEGKIFPQDSMPPACKNLLQGEKCNVQSFGRALIESKKDNDLIYNKSVFIGPEGEQQIEQSWEKNGHVQKAIIENKIIGKLMQMEVKDGKVFYQVTDQKDHSVKKSEDSLDENLVVPSTIMSYIKPMTDKISSGEKIQVKIAVLERMEAYTFNIKKVRDEKTLSGEPVQVLEMAPASIIVKALVSPMYFHIKTKTGEMFAFEGESAVRRKVGDNWKKMQVFTAYEYKVNTSVAAASKSECDPAAMLSGKLPMKCEVKQ